MPKMKFDTAVMNKRIAERQTKKLSRTLAPVMTPHNSLELLSSSGYLSHIKDATPEMIAYAEGKEPLIVIYPNEDDVKASGAYEISWDNVRAYRAMGEVLKYELVEMYKGTENAREKAERIWFQIATGITHFLDSNLGELDEEKFSRLEHDRLYSIFEKNDPEELKRALNGERVKSPIIAVTAREHKKHATIDELKHTISEHETTIKKHEKTILHLENEISGLNTHNRAVVEKKDREIEAKDAQIKSLSKQILKLEHRMAEMEERGMFGKE